MGLYNFYATYLPWISAAMCEVVWVPVVTLTRGSYHSHRFSCVASLYIPDNRRMAPERQNCAHPRHNIYNIQSRSSHGTHYYRWYSRNLFNVSIAEMFFSKRYRYYLKNRHSNFSYQHLPIAFSDSLEPLFLFIYSTYADIWYRYD
jgi:hypothetical protein